MRHVVTHQVCLLAHRCPKGQGLCLKVNLRVSPYNVRKNKLSKSGVSESRGLSVFKFKWHENKHTKGIYVCLTVSCVDGKQSSFLIS
jgi:hypothetical protein